MKVLLDTHAFLWWIADDQRVSVWAREIIGDGNNELFLSAATGWEIIIKVQIGRLKLPDEPQHYIESVYKLPIFSMSQRDECAGSDKLSISYIQERLQ